MPALNQAQRKAFNKALRALRKKLPTSYPVRVVWKRIPGYHGTTEFVKWGGQRIFKVTISVDCTWDEQIDALRHEYAHCLADPTWIEGLGGYTEEHHEVWGVFYSRCYAVLEAMNA